MAVHRHEFGGGGPDLVEVTVDPVPGARGLLVVAMTRDVEDVDQVARFGVVATGGTHHGVAQRVDAVEGELPAQQTPDRVAHHRVGADAREGPEHRHPDALGVETEGVAAHDRFEQSGLPRLPDPPEPVDHEVVADVVPPPDTHVVLLDAPQECRNLARRVAVGGHRVVDHGVADTHVGTAPRPGER